MKVVKIFTVHILIGIAVLLILLANAFLMPEPYSQSLIQLAVMPTKLMPFLENKEWMRELTLIVFVARTPNFAPITMLFLVVFWFFFGVLASITIHRLLKYRKNS